MKSHTNVPSGLVNNIDPNCWTEQHLFPDSDSVPHFAIPYTHSPQRWMSEWCFWFTFVDNIVYVLYCYAVLQARF